MKKETWFYVFLLLPEILAIVWLTFTLSSCKKIKYSSNRHVCHFSKCPYKGINPDEWNASVIKYTESDSLTDAWCRHITFTTSFLGL